MEQILLTDCYDLCGCINLDGQAEIFVYPYCWMGTESANGAKPPTWKLEKATAPVAIMSSLQILIQPKTFSGKL